MLSMKEAMKVRELPPKLLFEPDGFSSATFQIFREQIIPLLYKLFQSTDINDQLGPFILS